MVHVKAGCGDDNGMWGWSRGILSFSSAGAKQWQPVLRKKTALQVGGECAGQSAWCTVSTQWTADLNYYHWWLPPFLLTFPLSVPLPLLCRYVGTFPLQTTEESEIHKQPVSFSSTLRSTHHFYTKSFFFPISSKLWVKYHSHFPDRETAAQKVGFVRKLLEVCAGTQVSCSCTTKWLPVMRHNLLPVVVPKPDVWKQQEPVLQQVPSVTLVGCRVVWTSAGPGSLSSLTKYHSYFLLVLLDHKGDTWKRLLSKS